MYLPYYTGALCLLILLMSPLPSVDLCSLLCLCKNTQSCQEDFRGPGLGFEMRPPHIVITFVNLFCTDLNVELSLCSYNLSAVPVYIGLGKFLLVLVFGDMMF